MIRHLRDMRVCRAKSHGLATGRRSLEQHSHLESQRVDFVPVFWLFLEVAVAVRFPVSEVWLVAASSVARSICDTS